jgi:hypothetical protein
MRSSGILFVRGGWLYDLRRGARFLFAEPPFELQPVLLHAFLLLGCFAFLFARLTTETDPGPTRYTPNLPPASRTGVSNEWLERHNHLREEITRLKVKAHDLDLQMAEGN